MLSIQIIKFIHNRWLIILFVLISTLSGAILISYWHRDKGIILEVNPSIIDDFEQLIESKPPWLDGFKIRRHDGSHNIWQIQLSMLQFDNDGSRMKIVADEICQWSNEIGHQNDQYMYNILFLAGANNNNVTMQRTNEWPKGMADMFRKKRTVDVVSPK